MLAALGETGMSPPTPDASPALASPAHELMRTKLKTMLAYPFDCTLTLEAYEQVATAAAPARLLALSACLALLPAVCFSVRSLE